MEENSKVYSSDALLITNDEILNIKIYNENNDIFEKGIAYLDGDYFYIYRGEITEKELQKEGVEREPGIYRCNNKNYLFKPMTDEERKYYSYEDKISSIDPNKIIEMINTKEKILVPVPESSKLFIPVINKEDDILKRLIKKALIEKNIDIDQYRHRFLDKNALFNFKQVIKGTNTLSILLFDRGCDALNLKYTLIIEEADPDNVIGEKLESSIMASSDDVYDL